MKFIKKMLQGYFHNLPADKSYQKCYDRHYVNTDIAESRHLPGTEEPFYGVNPWTTMVGRLLARTRQLTSEATIGRSVSV